MKEKNKKFVYIYTAAAAAAADTQNFLFDVIVCNHNPKFKIKKFNLNKND